MQLLFVDYSWITEMNRILSDRIVRVSACGMSGNNCLTERGHPFLMKHCIYLNETMDQLEQLLEKFWDNRISLPELQQLFYLLSVHKSDLYNQATLDIESLTREVEGVLAARRSEEILINIHNRIGVAETAVIPAGSRGYIYRWVAAASLIGFVLAGFYLFSFPKKNHTGRQEITAMDIEPRGGMERVENNSSGNKEIWLKDSSAVVLEPGAVLLYQYPFKDNKRDISLTGNALFKVKKDKNRPFTVYAVGVATRALGTEFWVYAGSPNSVIVDLLEGRVFVKAEDNRYAFLKGVTLTAGQRLSINRLNNEYLVSNSSEKRVTGDRPVSLTARVPESLAFDNAPLDKVFARIQQYYKQPIIFREEDVKGQTFTGDFLRSDSISVVLAIICNMNNLAFTREEAGIVITKE